MTLGPHLYEWSCHPCLILRKISAEKGANAGSKQSSDFVVEIHTSIKWDYFPKYGVNALLVHLELGHELYKQKVSILQCWKTTFLLGPGKFSGAMLNFGGMRLNSQRNSFVCMARRYGVLTKQT